MPTLTVLTSIIYNHNACLSRVFVCVSMRYCHLNTSLFLMYLRNHYYFLSSLSRYSLWLSFDSDFKIIIFFINTMIAMVLLLSGKLACRLAGTDCTNRQMPKILTVCNKVLSHVSLDWAKRIVALPYCVSLQYTSVTTRGIYCLTVV